LVVIEAERKKSRVKEGGRETWGQERCGERRERRGMVGWKASTEIPKLSPRHYFPHLQLSPSRLLDLSTPLCSCNTGFQPHEEALRKKG